MSEKRFSWETEKLQHSDDEVLVVVDNENKEWKGHILNIVDLLNKLSEENEQLKIQLLNCEQKKNDNGGFQVWEMPPIPQGKRITLTTNDGGDGV